MLLSGAGDGFIAVLATSGGCMPRTGVLISGFTSSVGFLLCSTVVTGRGRLDSSFVQRSMLHGSETWPVRNENEVALQWAEMRIVRWMCGIKLQDRVPSKGLRERLGLDDIISVLQQNRLRWYGHVLQKEDSDLVKKCMEYQVEGARPRGKPKKTWTEIAEKDCQTRKLNREDAMDCNKRRKKIRGD